MKPNNPTIPIYVLSAAPTQIFQVCQRFGSVALVLGYCRTVIITKQTWLPCCAFRREGGPDPATSFPIPQAIPALKEEEVTLEILEEQPWMRRSAATAQKGDLQ